MGTVVTSKLGLAAFIKVSGASIKQVIPSTNTFVFEDETEKSLKEWEMAYMNTCCYRHDSTLVHLRRLLRS